MGDAVLAALDELGPKMGYVVAVVGATGNVGREMLNILAERGFPVTRVDAVACAAAKAKKSALATRRRNAKRWSFMISRRPILPVCSRLGSGEGICAKSGRSRLRGD